MSVAFKNIIASKRVALRTIQAFEPNNKYIKFLPSIREYKEKMEAALVSDCESIIELIKTLILSKPAADEPKAFFLKLSGDYYRY